MYHIVIFCGGTGSIALQKGFAELFGNKCIQFHFVINAYDNGLSTGECRKVFLGKVPGPSDLRKNQLTQYEIKYAEELKNPQSVQSRLYDFMMLRLSAVSCLAYYEKAARIISEQEYLEPSAIDWLQELLRYFFFDGDNLRDSVRGVTFDNFSLSNIFYASAAAINGFSLSKAGTQIASFLSIKDNVILISDISLFLHARTESGFVIEDEKDIICWNNPEDKIAEIFLTDISGKEYMPETGEGNEQHNVKELINHADMLIFSSGTQWSSLIPTYVHKGFREAIGQSKASKYLIMNNAEDGDMYGVSADRLCEILQRYLDLDTFTIIMNNHAPEMLNTLSGPYKAVYGNFSSCGDKKHNPFKLVLAIMEDFYGKDILQKKHYMFDLDGTLWDSSEGEAGNETGIENLSLFPGCIVSGNSYEHLKNILAEKCRQERDIAVYCDYGNTFFMRKSCDKIYRLTELFDMEEDVCQLINGQPEYNGKCRMRGRGGVLTIKPLADRESHIKKINELLSRFHGKYTAKTAGNTSIDITDSNFSKAVMAVIIAEKENMSLADILFVGNEVHSGSEAGMEESGIRALQVNDIYECNVFLKVLHKIKNKKE